MTTTHALDPLSFPLHGSRLIEASAGTGKTYTIAALYLRLILGHGHDGIRPARPLLPADILVMTFTRAATRELSDRIRARLNEAARAFREPSEKDDSLIAELREHYPNAIARNHAAWRLATAAEAMDEAAVFTIDAWCQRMLREHAFDSGSPFQETLVTDELSLRREALHDYWRREVYPLQGNDLTDVLECWPDAQAFSRNLWPLIGRAMPTDAHDTLADRAAHARQQQQQRLHELAEGWVARTDRLRGWLDDQVARHKAHWQPRKLAPGTYGKWLQQITDWATDPTSVPLALTDTARDRLSPEGLQRIRKEDAPPLTPPAESFELAELLRELAALPNPQTAMRQHAAVQVTQGVARLKAERRQFGFADMLDRLEQALTGPHGERLRERILAQYPVAMIDEFQDSSAQQYRIFDALYRTAHNDPDTALLFIGDPKQSIYGFRGADIYSYLKAREATAGRHYVLGTNFRSSQALVSAVNAWFELAESRPGAGAFGFRHDGANPLPFAPVAARGRDERFVVAKREAPALEIVHDLELRKAEDRRTLAAERCAERIATWLSDEQAGFVNTKEALSRLQPADIAVLVRQGNEARLVRQALHRRGIASVYLSDRDSVYASEQARDLQYWLLAVANPLDARQVRAGLATPTLGLPLTDLAALAHDDTVFDQYSERMRDLHQVWRRLGVLAMLRHTLHHFDLPARWLAEPDGERRLTNFLHLAELLQQASATVDGELALVRWFANECSDGGGDNEEQVLRLESDADLVKVVTVHKSKGLEYPVVCLPFACEYRKTNRNTTTWREDIDERGHRTTRLELSDDDLNLAEAERLQEDLRLFYVAMTRARHAIWLHFHAVGTVRGNDRTCENDQSAPGHLLNPTVTPQAEQWLPALQQLQHGNAVTGIRLAAAEASLPVTRISLRKSLPDLRDIPTYATTFERRWSLASFSSLTQSLSVHPVANDGGTDIPSAPSQPRLRPAADEADPFDPAPLAPDAGPPADPPRRLPQAASDAAPWHRFPRGPVVGDFLHDQLEWLAGEHFDLIGNLAVETTLRRRCERAGHGERADDVVAWLHALLAAPLPALGATLPELQHLLPEMEFWLPTEHLPTPAIDALCRQHLLAGAPRAALAERELHGMLMGFADLVFEHAGRFWVLDYKSNTLGADGAAYHPQALQQLMAHHRYDVQGAIYLLALHRLLRARLGNTYDPAAQLGGAIFLFVRGIDAEGQGEYALPANANMLELIDAFDHLLPAAGSLE